VDVSTAGVFQTLLVAILQKSTRYSVCIFNGGNGFNGMIHSFTKKKK
jgi:hypothetical protein